MKKHVSIFVAAALACAALYPTSAFAQWNYGQNSIYNSIESRIDARKTRARFRARQAKRPSTKKTSAALRQAKHKDLAITAKRRAVPVKKAIAPLPHHDVSFHRDTFQDFHQDDMNGYVVTFTFAPTGGNVKPIAKTYHYSHLKYRHVAEYNDLPAATYTVTAVAVYNKRTYPVHLGTEQGTPSDPQGGNFASSVQLVVKPAKDNYGDIVVQGSPSTVYVRVIEQ